MAVEQDILRFVYPGSEIVRPALVGMEFLHKGSVSLADLIRPRPRLKPQDLVGLLFRHRAAARRVSAPPARMSLHVLTLAGRPAVKISFE